MKLSLRNPTFAAVAMLQAVFIALTIETFVSASPARWWVLGAAGMQVIAVAIAWQRQIRWRTTLVASFAWLGATFAIRAGALHAAWNQLVVAIASSSIVAAGLPKNLNEPATRSAGDSPAAHADAPSVGIAAERLAALENSFRAIEDGLRESPRDRWDPEYVVQQVGNDPDHLFDWVRDNTSWIPYRGVLRGAAGVLNDRLGNSLDRAVLLATLLQKADRDVRLAQRELSLEEGLELVSAAATALPSYEGWDEVTEVDAQGADDEIPTIATQYQLDAAAVSRTLDERAKAIDALASDLDTRVEGQTDQLLSAIDAPAAGDERRRRIDAAVAAVRDHWWVQRRAGDAWVDLDLLASERPAEARAAVPAATFTLAGIAPLHHELAIRLIAEKSSGGTATERQAFEYVLHPAEVIGQPVILQFWPSDWWTDGVLTAADPQQGFREMALEQQQWDVALTVGDAVVAQASLAASGNVVSAQKGGPMGTIRGTFGAAPPGAEESKHALTAVWLEYEIRSPSAPPRHIRREVFDLRGPAARAAKATVALDDRLRLTRSLALMMRTEILPIICRLAPEYVADLAARSVLADRALLTAVARGEIAAGTPETEQLLNDAAPAFTPLYSLALARLEWSRHAEQLYIDRLNVLARHRFLAPTPDGLVLREATDIVANEVGVELAALDAFAIRVDQGVFDTNAERMLQVAGRPLGNTAQAFASSTDWITLRSRGDTAQLRVPVDAQRRIAESLDAGYWIVAPPKPVAIGSEPFVGWWRIDSTTGDTLGVAANGWGQDMAERGVQYSVFREMAERFVFDYLLCRAIPVVANAVDMPIVKELFPMESKEKAHNGCLISAIASGAAFATLPLLLATLRYAGRSVSPLLRGVPRFGPKPPGGPRLGPKPPGTPRPPKVRPCL